MTRIYWYLALLGLWCVFSGAWALREGDLAGALVVAAGAGLVWTARGRLVVFASYPPGEG